MKLYLPLITAEFAICLGSLAQTTPDQTWPFGLYDKVIPKNVVSRKKAATKKVPKDRRAP